jgi:hypothetical protein
LEFFCILKLERDLKVVNFGSQPEKFVFVDATGKKHTYVPDFKVFLQDGGIEIHEVTVAKRRLTVDLLQREAAGNIICGERGWRYVVHTEQTLPNRTETANLMALLCFRANCYRDPAIARALKGKLITGERWLAVLLVSEISGELGCPNEQASACLAHMLWHCELETEFATKLFFDYGSIATDVSVWLTTQEAG